MLSRAISAALLFVVSLPAGTRTVVSLDGTWEVGDAPGVFGHRAPVPGLANLSQPAFADVDRFDSRELIDVEIRDNVRPESARTKAVGVPHQSRTYFWYRRTFRVPERRQTAVLTIGKAQFGAVVWLNGKAVGEHVGCFTAAIFDVTAALNWNGENELVIRIGAHPAAMPDWAPAGTDKEKLKWTPGIYDSVSLALADNPLIETVQVAPRLSDASILIETVVRNAGRETAELKLTQTVHEWKQMQIVAGGEQQAVRLAPGETKKIRTVLRILAAKLWTPETPSLYVLETSTNGDSLSTRFGMREFRYDTATRRAYLNGRLYFLRGSNIALHRFFEDPECKDLPWNEAWVRKLLVGIPKQMHWNSFRFTLGPAPRFWFDIADEAGLLIQNEFPIWQMHEEWRTSELLAEFREWMRDHWNHPSLAVWDASNETHAERLRDQVIELVRPLDLSGRPWDNGYTLPSGPDDPIEDHPYLFLVWQRPGWVRPGQKPFEITDLETMVGAQTDWNAPHPTTHAAINNEYGWLWLRRDGQPTLLTDKVYERLVGASATPEQRFEAYAYYLAGLTEFWRAHRNYAGVQHFVYLTCSYPGVKTSDNFRDVTKLELEPRFAEYVREAFRPLGLYINFWQPGVDAGSTREYAVMIVNDDPEPRSGMLALSYESAGKAHTRVEVPFLIPAWGQRTVPLRLAAPDAAGRYVLKAIAFQRGVEPTVSRRKVEVK